MNTQRTLTAAQQEARHSDGRFGEVPKDEPTVSVSPDRTDRAYATFQKIEDDVLSTFGTFTAWDVIMPPATRGATRRTDAALLVKAASTMTTADGRSIRVHPTISGPETWIGVQFRDGDIAAYQVVDTLTMVDDDASGGYRARSLIAALDDATAVMERSLRDRSLVLPDTGTEPMPVDAILIHNAPFSERHPQDPDLYGRVFTGWDDPDYRFQGEVRSDMVEHVSWSLKKSDTTALRYTAILDVNDRDSGTGIVWAETDDGVRVGRVVQRDDLIGDAQSAYDAAANASRALISGYRDMESRLNDPSYRF